MLGAIKGDDAPAGGSLFRLLSRRWKPLAPVKQRLLASRSADDSATLSRAWVGKHRPRYAPDALQAAEARAAKTWNPWMWMK